MNAELMAEIKLGYFAEIAVIEMTAIDIRKNRMKLINEWI